MKVGANSLVVPQLNVGGDRSLGPQVNWPMSSILAVLDEWSTALLNTVSCFFPIRIA